MAGSDRDLAFEPLAERPGLEVVDRIERRRYALHTPGPVDPTPTDVGPFRFPVDRAVSFRAGGFSFPRVVSVYVRDESGRMVAEVEHLDSVSLPEGRYTLDLSAQITTYAEVEGPVEVSADMFQTRVEFESATEILLGARSQHQRPAATVTTTENPRDVMAAVETFSSALKTTSPERSYPTLRGHPPAVEFGDALEVPDRVEPAETGVTLEVPTDLEAVYAVAPLAYYLGADLVPGPTPRLVADGLEYSLSAPDGFEKEVERVLKQVFFLDCLTRTEGYYQLNLHERNAVEPLVDLEFGALYDRPLSAQLAAYLDVPFGTLEAHVPRWPLTAHVEPVAGSLEQLPYVVDDLAVVRSTPAESRTRGSGGVATQELTRGGDGFTRSVGAGGSLPRAASDAADAAEGYVQPEPTDAVGQAWIGEGVPVGASKLVPEAFENRFDREKTEGDIAITVVVNDERMAAEGDVVDDVYGDREDLPFDVTVRRNLSVAELEELLGRRCDFLHYIGHTEADGLECADGKLDADTLEESGIDTFLLNSCNSYRQGLSLIESGAIGGIVTLNDVINDSAVRIGECLARLLNAGFPLQAALSIAREESPFGGQYIVVGDGTMTVTQPASVVPYSCEVTEIQKKYEISIQTYSADGAEVGGLFIPHVTTNEEHYLIPGSNGKFNLEGDQLSEFFELENVPVRTDDELRWSGEIAERLD